ncbi:hypothetical protein CDO73_26265 [Saccharibacillus sp. O23]|nr:hypothetical protein B9G55_23940 [Saccharibacillus sp. O16]OWR25684.1 hypothetical protein CDO73_26265 [Saccharibacillus sp. O23]
MQSEIVITLAIIAGCLQIGVQLLGVAKAFFEWRTAKSKTKPSKAKGSDRGKRSKPQKRNRRR